MKKGIEAWPDYDASGRWCLRIKKARGHLSLEDIKEAAREIEWDFYLLVLDCFHDEDDVEQNGEYASGDYATLYRTDLFYEKGEH